MQQTEFYYLNKIERGDTFSPEALNENARATDGLVALADFTARTEAYTRAAETASLDRRVTALEVRKMVVGTYIGNAGTGDVMTKQTIELGFTPIAVIVQGSTVIMTIQNYTVSFLSLTETGFQVHNGTAGYGLNLSTNPYYYIAFG